MGWYCKACKYDLRALPAGHCPECSRAFDPADDTTFDHRPNADAWYTCRWASVVALWIVGVDTAVIFLLSVAGYDLALGFLLCIICSPIIASCLMMWLIAAVFARGAHVAKFLAVVVLGFVTWTIFDTQWPLKVMFALHKPAFEQRRLAVQNGEHVSPTRVGLYGFAAIEPYWTHDGMIVFRFNDTGESHGFYWTPTPDSKPQVNIWSATQVSDHWWLIYQD